MFSTGPVEERESGERATGWRKSQYGESAQNGGRDSFGAELESGSLAHIAQVWSDM